MCCQTFSFEHRFMLLASWQACKKKVLYMRQMREAVTGEAEPGAEPLACLELFDMRLYGRYSCSYVIVGEVGVYVVIKLCLLDF